MQPTFPRIQLKAETVRGRQTLAARVSLGCYPVVASSPRTPTSLQVTALCSRLSPLRAALSRLPRWATQLVQLAAGCCSPCLLCSWPQPVSARNQPRAERHIPNPCPSPPPASSLSSVPSSSWSPCLCCYRRGLGGLHNPKSTTAAGRGRPGSCRAKPRPPTPATAQGAMAMPAATWAP